MANERAAIVTGASRGIGRAIALALAREEMTVGLLARSRPALERVAREIEARGGRAIVLPADVTRWEDVQRAFARFWEDVQRLDVLINNAGIGVFQSVEDMPIEAFDAVIRTNLYGVFYCCKLAIPLMRRTGGGDIIHIGSLAGRNPFAGGAAYCASKFALRGFSESLMLEVRYDHIRVSIIAPGSVNTEFAGNTPAHAWKLQPEDVARMVVELIRSRREALASYIEMRPLQPPRK